MKIRHKNVNTTYKLPTKNTIDNSYIVLDVITLLFNIIYIFNQHTPIKITIKMQSDYNLVLYTYIIVKSISLHKLYKLPVISPTHCETHFSEIFMLVLVWLSGLTF